jgi:hypothetical protein
MVLVDLLRQDGNPGIRDSTNLSTAQDAMPDKVVQPSAREELSARLAIKNGNSRDGL